MGDSESKQEVLRQGKNAEEKKEHQTFIQESSKENGENSYLFSAVKKPQKSQLTVEEKVEESKEIAAKSSSLFCVQNK